MTWHRRPQQPPPLLSIRSGGTCHFLGGRAPAVLLLWLVGPSRKSAGRGKGPRRARGERDASPLLLPCLVACSRNGGQPGRRNRRAAGSASVRSQVRSVARVGDGPPRLCHSAVLSQAPPAQGACHLSARAERVPLACRVSVPLPPIHPPPWMRPACNFSQRKPPAPRPSPNEEDTTLCTQLERCEDSALDHLGHQGSQALLRYTVHTCTYSAVLNTRAPAARLSTVQHDRIPGPSGASHLGPGSRGAACDGKTGRVHGVPQA